MYIIFIESLDQSNKHSLSLTDVSQFTTITICTQFQLNIVRKVINNSTHDQIQLCVYSRALIYM